MYATSDPCIHDRPFSKQYRWLSIQLFNITAVDDQLLDSFVIFTSLCNTLYLIILVNVHTYRILQLRIYGPTNHHGKLSIIEPTTTPLPRPGRRLIQLHRVNAMGPESRVPAWSCPSRHPSNGAPRRRARHLARMRQIQCPHGRVQLLKLPNRGGQGRGARYTARDATLHDARPRLAGTRCASRRSGGV